MTAGPGTRLPLHALGNRLPGWDPDALAAIARQHFDLRGRPLPLGGERDQNLRMLDGNGAPVVVKLPGAEEGRGPLALQTASLRHIAWADPGLNVPRVVTSNRGVDMVPITTGDRDCRYLRVLTRLPGETVENMGMDCADAGKVGEFASRLGRSLAGFSHPSSHQEMAWNLMSADRLRSEARCISSPERRRPVEVAFDIFLRHGLARLGAVRAQIVHNDTGPANLMADPVNPGGVGGVFDFGDMTHGPRIVPHLDAYNNVSHVGHAHPRIADAISRQSRLINTNTRYLLRRGGGVRRPDVPKGYVAAVADKVRAAGGLVTRTRSSTASVGRGFGSGGSSCTMSSPISSCWESPPPTAFGVRRRAPSNRLSGWIGQPAGMG